MAALALLLAGCVAAPPPPVARPVPRPVVAPPPPVAVPIADWRDAPLSPGAWSWSGTVARFGALSVSCPRVGEVVLDWRGAAPAGATVPLVITTTNGARQWQAGATEMGALTLRLSARDAVLDSIAFTRGRWMIEAAGGGRMIVPTGPEFSRVVEDCRR